MNRPRLGFVGLLNKAQESMTTQLKNSTSRDGWMRLIVNTVKCLSHNAWKLDMKLEANKEFMGNLSLHS